MLNIYLYDMTKEISRMKDDVYQHMSGKLYLTEFTY